MTRVTILGQMEENELEKALENKFFGQAKFAQEIENMVKINSELTYIDAILQFCEIHNLDVESIPKLISKPLKEKIRCEATNLNFLKKTSQAKLVF